jgi:hypothetical protein
MARSNLRSMNERDHYIEKVRHLAAEAKHKISRYKRFTPYAEEFNRRLEKLDMSIVQFWVALQLRKKVRTTANLELVSLLNEDSLRVVLEGLRAKRLVMTTMRHAASTGTREVTHELTTEGQDSLWSVPRVLEPLAEFFFLEHLRTQLGLT